MKCRFGLMMVVVCGIAAQSYAVTQTVDFLKLSPGVRVTGMGEAGVAVCPDVISSYLNPAGLSNITTKELGFSHSEAVMDASLEYISFAYPFSGNGTVGVSAEFYMVKPIPVTLASGESIGDLNWRGQLLAVSYGRNLTKRLSVGAAVKVIQQLESDPIFGTNEGTAYAMDAGVIYQTAVKGLNAGGALTNSGTDLQMSGETRKDPLPRTSRFGIAYQYEPNDNTSITAAGDMYRVLDGDWNVGGGVELFLRNILFIRFGYYTKEGNIAGNTYGFGLKSGNYQIDYSNVPASEMVGYTRNNKVSLIVKF